MNWVPCALTISTGLGHPNRVVLGGGDLIMDGPLTLPAQPYGVKLPEEIPLFLPQDVCLICQVNKISFVSMFNLLQFYAHAWLCNL